jgi:hypothetical protein
MTYFADSGIVKDGAINFAISPMIVIVIKTAANMMKNVFLAAALLPLRALLASSIGEFFLRIRNATATAQNNPMVPPTQTANSLTMLELFNDSSLPR